MKKILLLVAISSALSACSGETKTKNLDSNVVQNQTSEPQASTHSTNSRVESSATTELQQKVEKHTLAFLQQQPTLSSMLALSEQQAGGSYNHRFPDYSPAGMQTTQKAMTSAYQDIQSLDSNSLETKYQTHQSIVTNIFEYYAGFPEFSGGYIDTWAGHLPYIINQISGPLIDVPKLMQVQQSVTNEAEIRAYLARLENMNTFVANVVSKYQEDQAKGIVLPQKLHPKTLGFFDNFLAAEPKEHELIKTFSIKLDAITELSVEERQKYTDLASNLVATVVYPAYEKAKQAVLESQKIAKNEDGIWSQPNGEQFYQHSIRFLGDSTMTAEEIHQVGLSEVARISKQMDTILKANGYTEGSVGERMIAVANDPKQLYADTDEGRQALLDGLNQQIDAIMAKAPQYYGTMPTQSVEVRRIPPVSEAGEAGGFYTPPSLDGKRPGIYWINLRDMGAVPKFGLTTLTYHEAVPGHHFQIALNMAQQDIGLMRQNAPYNGYVEGWALYSEYFASEVMGMYKNDQLGDLGRLQAELYRAVRLVVDTGLHFKRWTREQAIDYFHKTSGTSLSDVVPEIERYMAWPGQALGYKLGMLKFVELQQKAVKELGDKLDYRRFHDVILLPGARPMELVEQDVNKWIETQVRQLTSNEER